NKGFQQLFRDDQCIGGVNGAYGFDLDALPTVCPYVYKPVEGAGSSGERKAVDDGERTRIIRKKAGLSRTRKIINLARFFKLTKSEYLIYRYNKKTFSAYVTQAFVEGLDCDYKVLVFADKYYVLKRGIWKGDFKASGSGLFDFQTPPDGLLD